MHIAINKESMNPCILSKYPDMNNNKRKKKMK